MDLKNLVSAERISDHIKTLCGYQRLSGTAQDHEAVGYIVKMLSEHHVPFTLHEFPAYISLPGRARLTLSSPTRSEIPCITHSFGASTPAGGLELRLVYVGDGEEEDYARVDVRGKAAVIGGYRGLAVPEKMRRAENHGALAVVTVNYGEVLHEMIVSTVWGCPTLETIGEMPRIPAISISAESGEALRKLIVQGEVVASITAEVDTRWRTLKLPVAEIQPEAGRSQDFFLLGGHMDSWYEGSTDNATGDATLLELAIAFNELRGELKRAVRVAWWPGHSHGRYAGSGWYADNRWLELSRHCVGVLIVDSPGVRGATVQRLRTSEEARGYALAKIASLGFEKSTWLRPERVGDQAFMNLGITSMSLNSELEQGHPDRRPVGGSGGAWWWHSRWDTVEKADAVVCAADAVAIGEVVKGIASAAVLPYDLSAMMRHFEEAFSERTKDLHESVDTACAIELLQQAGALAATFEMRVSAGTIACGDANRAIIRATRAVNKVLYCRRDEFTQDPASGQGLLPGLSVAPLTLSADPDTAGFSRCQARREMNRVLNALSQVVEALA